uniref:BART domain-containing protein n=1 Tax=Rhizochromulina marina TaxID=1034831 RepID=A0A7S2RLK9_9STRA|mmetsp:Transcript_18030/g.52691  ORF Transcript_18030/g.52691 Transcript_18030/m.52691 type:complete len:182 (+) Transcript_18030:44-589(+)|eukprot:CAMPEP_0118962406 /NCGR_PEP_ID=MMETSP1173-20130426/756_1 /TAXON_ID=1034831 /ORGANISM="Rhizochromulina marina cf, Strain CCMP1243" /LENGTH=181 /DNA_ID=CAMNT_0006910665 /DNA_START=18 /DNA_END=563 /DNA_ORIENTATION=+
MPRLDDEDEYKSEGKYSEGKAEDEDKAAGDEDEDFVLPGMYQAEEDTMLVRLATYCNTGPFAESMENFVLENSALWERYGDVTGAGEGASHEELGRLKQVHEEFLLLFEDKLERFVRREGGDLAELMEECRDAMQQKHAWLFEDENYAAFVGWMKSVLDFEHFHQLMESRARQRVQTREHK